AAHGRFNSGRPGRRASSARTGRGEVILSSAPAHGQLEDMRWTAALLAAWAVKAARGGPVGKSGGDVQSSGPCKAAIASYCPTVPPGGGQLALCLTKTAARNGADKGLLERNGVTSACITEVKHVLRDSPGAAAKASKGVITEEACAQDEAGLCAGLSGDAALPCLRAHREELSRKCSKQLFLVDQLRAGDNRLDLRVIIACQADLMDPERCGKMDKKNTASARAKCLFAQQQDTLSEKCRLSLANMEAVDKNAQGAKEGGGGPSAMAAAGGDVETQRMCKEKMREICGGQPRDDLPSCVELHMKDLPAECHAATRPR
ncbi:unnamed protein product, partial [Prorocentrum cordatum]